MNRKKIENSCKKVIKDFPKVVQEYKAGSTGLLGALTGQAMHYTKGKADHKTIAEILN
jgi:Asp-tRNA(Asn)/Glu-tRNA(Gln) amidotransferase B subunit